MDLVYFDNSATTKPAREVIEETLLCMERYFGNPSSAHRLGLEAEKKLKAAREKVAKLIGADSREIVFTSGGSEANNMALRGVVSPGDHIITSKIEHPSVLETTRALEHLGVEVTYLDVENSGVIKLDLLKDSIKDNTKLVSIMHVNNEIGSIQPIEDIAGIVRQKNKRAKIHIDAVQSAGKLPIDVKKLDVDSMSISAHKIHGPKGVGALYVKRGFTLNPLITGGGQESQMRSGTENLPGICGFAAAAESIIGNIEQNMAHVKKLKEHFLKRLDEIESISVNSPQDDVHSPYILNVSFEGVRGEVLLHALEDYNIYVSTGSACSARKGSHKNYVLPAIGLRESCVEGAIRFSFSYLNKIDEVDFAIDALKKILPFLRRIKK